MSDAALQAELVIVLPHISFLVMQGDLHFYCPLSKYPALVEFLPIQVFRHIDSGEHPEQKEQQLRANTTPPMEFHLIWRSLDKNPVSFWAPVPQPGYAAMGALATAGLDLPCTRDILCVSNGMTQPASVYDSPAWQWEPQAVRRPPLPAILLHVLPCLWPFCALCGQVHVIQASVKTLSKSYGCSSSSNIVASFKHSAYVLSSRVLVPPPATMKNLHICYDYAV